jgi:hypothetical protein
MMSYVPINLITPDAMLVAHFVDIGVIIDHHC